MRSRVKSLRTIHAIKNSFCLDRQDIIEFVNRCFPFNVKESIAELNDYQLDMVASHMLSFSQLHDLCMVTDYGNQLVSKLTKESIVAKQKIEIIEGGSAPVEDILDILAKELNKGVKEREDKYFHNLPEFTGRMDRKEILPFGIPQIDAALGVGGLKSGKMHIIYGPEGSGKTTFALNVVREHQKANLPVIYFDSENALSSRWVEIMGIDSDKMKVSATSNLNHLAEMIKKINQRVTNCLIVIDSIPGFLTQDALRDDRSFDKVRQLGTEAMLWKELLYSEASNLARNNNTLLCISQERANINKAHLHDNDNIIAGGKAIHYATTTRIRLKKMGRTISESDIDKSRRTTDIEIRLEIEKNKTFRNGIQLKIPNKIDKPFDRAENLEHMFSTLKDDYNPLFPRKKRLEDGKVVNTNSLAKVVFFFDDEALEAVRADEPDFEPVDGNYMPLDETEGVTVADWLNEHPTYMDYCEDFFTRVSYLND